MYGTISCSSEFLSLTVAQLRQSRLSILLSDILPITMVDVHLCNPSTSVCLQSRFSPGNPNRWPNPFRRPATSCDPLLRPTPYFPPPRLWDTSERHFLCRSSCSSPRSRRTTGTTTSRKAYRSPSCKVCVQYCKSYCAHSGVALEKTSSEDEKHEAEDNGQTIRPSRSPGVVPSPLPLAKPPAAEIEPIPEDFSDFDFAEDDDNLQAKVADFKVRHHVSE